MTEDSLKWISALSQMQRLPASGPDIEACKREFIALGAGGLSREVGSAVLRASSLLNLNLSQVDLQLSVTSEQ
jgi:hypothetical protein